MSALSISSRGSALPDDRHTGGSALIFIRGFGRAKEQTLSRRRRHLARVKRDQEQGQGQPCLLISESSSEQEDEEATHLKHNTHTGNEEEIQRKDTDARETDIL